MLIKCALILTLFNYGLTQNCFEKNNIKRNLNLKLVCYYSEINENVDACKCTHIILPSNTNRTIIENFKNNFKGSNVLITVNEINENVIEILKGETVDGIEINLKKLNHKNDLNDFITTIKSKINSNLIISILLPSKTEILAKYYDLKALTKRTDFFILQTAFLVSDQNVTFHPSRLSGLWDMQNSDSTVDLVHGLGVPLSKLVITSPVQAFEFILLNETLTAPGSPATEIKSINRRELCEQMSNGINWTLERDQDLTSPYIFSKNKWIAFEDGSSIDVKAKYARVRGLGGLALKDLSQDSKNCNGSILEFAYDGLSKQSRAPRGVVLQSLKREILETPSRPLDTIQISPYRISRIIDVEGNVHSIRKDTRTEFECSRQGYFVHPRSCGRFFRCVKFDQLADEFNVFEFDCPDGLTFDDKNEVCVWPGSLPYSSACSGSSEIAPVPKTRFICPSEEGYYADPENCRWFFACLDHGKSPLSAYEFRCPFGLAFDQSRLVCEWSWLVSGCGSIETLDISAALVGLDRAKLESYDGLGALGVVKFGQSDGSLHQSQSLLNYNILDHNSALTSNFLPKIQQSGQIDISGISSQKTIQPNVLSTGDVHENAFLNNNHYFGSQLSAVTNEDDDVKLGKNQFFYKTFAVPNATANVVGGASAVQFYNRNLNNVLQLRPVSFSIPPSVQTVVAAPVPILTSNGETYKDGVVANVPELQFKIIVPDELTSNNDFKYAQRTNLGGIFNYQAFDLNKGIQKNFPSDIYPQPNVVFEGTPSSTIPNRFGSVYQLGQSGNVDRNSIYGNENVYFVNGPSSTIRPLAVAKVEQVVKPIQVSSYGFSEQNADLGKGQIEKHAQTVFVTPAPVVSQQQNLGELSSSISQNHEGYVYSRPSVRFEEHPSPIVQQEVVSNLQQIPIISKPVPTVATETRVFSQPSGITEYNLGNYKESVAQINNDFAKSQKVAGHLNNYYEGAIIASSPAPTTYFNVQPQLKAFTAAIQSQKGYVYTKPSIKFEESPAIQPAIVSTVKQESIIPQNVQINQNVVHPASITSYSVQSQHEDTNNKPNVILNEFPSSTVRPTIVSNFQQLPVVLPTIQTIQTPVINYNSQRVQEEIAPVRNLQFEQPKVPASVSSYSVQDQQRYIYQNPNVIFNPSSTVRPAFVSNVQQAQAVVPTVTGYSEQRQQGYSYQRPKVIFNEFPSSTVRPAIVSKVQQVPVVVPPVAGYSEQRQQGYSYQKPKVIFNEFPSSAVRPAVAFDVQQAPVVVPTVTGYSEQRQQGYSYQKPKVIFNEFPSSTVRPAVAFDVQQAPVVVPTVASYSEQRQQGYSYQRPKVVFNEFPSSTVRPAVAYGVQKAPVVVSTVASYSEQRQQGYSYQKPKVIFNEFPSSNVRPAVAFDVQQAPVVVPTVTGYSEQRQQGYSYQKPKVLFNEFPSSTIHPAVAVDVQQAPVVVPTVTGYSEQRQQGYSYKKPKVLFNEFPSSTIHPAVAVDVQQAPVVVPTVTGYSEQRQQGYSYKKPKVLFNEFPSSTIHPAVAVDVQQAPVVVPTVTGYSEQRQQGYSYQKPKVVFNELPSSTVRPAIPFDVQQAPVVVPTVQTIQEQPSPIPTYNIDLNLKPAVEQVEQVNLKFEQELNKRPQVSSLRPAVVSYNINSRLEPLEEAVVISQSGQNVESVTSSPPAITYNFRNFAKTQVPDRANIFAINSLPEPQVFVTSTVQPATVLSEKVQPFEVQKAQFVINTENAVSQPASVSEYGFKNYPNLAPIDQSNTAGVVIKDTLQQQPAIISSYSFENSQYNQNIKPKFVQVTQKPIYSDDQPVFVQPSISTSFKQTSDAYVASIAQPVSRYSFQDIVKIRPLQTVTSERIQEQPPSSIFQGYQYPKPNVVFEEKRLEPVTVTSTQNNFEYIRVKPSLVKTKTVSAVTPITIEDTIITKQEVKIAPSEEKSGYFYSKPSIPFQEGLGDYGNKEPIEEEPFVAKKTYLTYQQVDELPSAQIKNEKLSQIGVKKGSIIEDYTYSSPQTVRIDQVVSQPSITFNEGISKQYKNEETFGAKNAYFDGQNGKKVENYSTTRVSQSESVPSQNLKESGYYYPKPSVTFTEGFEDYGNKQPVVEEAFVAKKAYLTYQQESEPQKYQNGAQREGKSGTVYVENYSATQPTKNKFISPIYVEDTTSEPELYISTLENNEEVIETTTARKVALNSRGNFNYKNSVLETSTLTTPPALPIQRFLSAQTQAPEDTEPLTSKPKEETLRRTYLPAKLKSEPKSKTYIRVNDFNPLLSAKLGAECTCTSNTVTLRRPSVAKSKNVDELPSVSQEDGVVVENYSFEPQRTEDVSLRSSEDISTNVQPSGKIVGKKLVRIRPVTTTEFVEIEETTKRARSRGKVTTEGVRSRSYDRYEATVSESDTKALQGTSVNSRIKEATTQAIQASFDRYGPGGLRSSKETLQGTVDCQREGLFRHPEKCNKFYACRWDCNKKKYSLHVFNCPVHLTFDYNMGACNWPSKGPACAGDTLLPNE